MCNLWLVAILALEKLFVPPTLARVSDSERGEGETVGEQEERWHFFSFVPLTISNRNPWC